jgi:glutathione S-transferase
MVNYTLNYFNGRGRAEISRLIFAAAGVEFNDNRILDWPSKKTETPLGQVPYLSIDDFQLPQSLAIARYLARENKLVGKDNLQAAKADAIVDTCVDLMTGFYYKVFLITDLSTKV